MRSIPIIASLAYALACLPAMGAGPVKPVATFTENKGQWPDNVLYRTRFPGGALFVEKNAFTFTLSSGGVFSHHAHDHDEAMEPVRSHAYRVTFEGAQLPRGEGVGKQGHYENYFIGNDPGNWGTGCAVYGEVILRDIYPGIDLRIDGSKGLKYEFILDPGVDPSLIRMKYEGQDKLFTMDGRLHVHTTCGDVIEEEPIALFEETYDPYGGFAFVDVLPTRRVPAGPCSFMLRGGNTVSFNMERQPHRELIIDPDLTFGSYSGSSADNFGFTATYDNDGNLYGGGIAFGFGYPVSVGAVQGSFAGGFQDIGLTKFSADGTELLWSTYLGGSFSNETPHSLVVNQDDELFVLAVTGSSDFPTTAGCYDNTFSGGPSIPFSGGFVNLFSGEGYDFTSGTDIAIVHLAADAQTLIGSTFVGGSANDGLNQSASLVHNYGDHFRGEIALDASGAPAIATSTQSSDAPTTPGAAQATYGGGVLDGYLFGLNPALTSLSFATYCGGSGDDSGFGVQFASNGEVFLTGGTTSSNLPMNGTPFDNSYNGAIDGYIARYSAGGGAQLSTTYVGTTEYDQSYFVQLNTSDEVYVVGQTHGAYPVTPGKYTNPGSAQFIHKFSQDLSTSIWSTRIGNGSGVEDIAPSAFLVSDCGQIYFSGWGGSTNWNITAASGSTTTGMPLSSDAFQSATDGNDVYLMVLQPEAIALNYATYIGGNISAEHVDGGTSRFDKNGNVYQAVCAGCWTNSDFPTTPGAWSNTNGSLGGCNLAVFKFNLTTPFAEIDIDGPNYVCLPGTAQFTNTSIGGTSYDWDFGDNQTSTLFAPNHAYADTGIYVITMILSDSSGCVPNDTAQITIAVVAPGDAVIDPVDTICLGQDVQLHAHGGHAYEWFPTAGLNDPTIADPIATPDSSMTYYVVVTDSCGIDTADVFVFVGIGDGEAGPDALVCSGSSVQITAIGGGSYTWTPANTLDDPNAQSPNASPLDTTQYNVVIITPGGCIVEDSLVVYVQSGLPDPVVPDTAICLGTSATLHASGGDSYAWQPGPGLNATNGPDAVATPTSDGYFVVILTNTCGSVADSAFVDVQQVIASAWPDTIICPGETTRIFATGGTFYDWSPAGGLSAPDSSVTDATPSAPTTYTVTASNALGCEGTASVHVDLFPEPNVDATYDTGIDYGEMVQLVAWGNGSMVWSPSATLSCDSCVAPVAFPEQTTTYTVELTDANGCKAFDVVTVFVNGTLYVPNTFTPDDDGINDSFRAIATEIKEFRLLVFNRWGEEIYQADRQDRSWDGTYMGVQSPIDTYVWRIDLTELNGKKRTVFGHVNLVR